MIFLGIDPGKAGGLAWIGPEGPRAVVKMPETERDLWELLHSHYDYALIERIETRPTHWKDKDGVEQRSILRSSVLLFGQYQLLRGLLVARGIPFDDVRPQVWRVSLGVPARSGLPGIKQKAQQLYPNAKVTHATAAALLIAELARRRHRSGHVKVSTAGFIDDRYDDPQQNFFDDLEG